MNYLPHSDGFLGLSDEYNGEFRVCVIPFPMDSTVSWKTGAAAGPQAILEASHQVELFDETRMREPCEDFALRTRTPVLPAPDAADALDQIASIVEEEHLNGYFPLILGGEHSITAGACRPFSKAYEELVIVQLDAHADLRDGYEGEHFSHAAAMRRCLDNENVRLISFGIRSISTEELPFLKEQSRRIEIYWAHERQTWDLADLTQSIAGRPVYLTIDVDGFDSSLMPATGTPEPGGLFWENAIDIIQAVSGCGRIVGADIVELAPRPGFHACDFLAAKLAYRVLAFARESAE